MTRIEQERPRIGIVAIGYNRIESMMRLLNRLNDCEYPSGDIPLVVSLDNCGSDEMYNHVQRFEWQHGSKTVILQPQRLGLRNHVLRCGEYMHDYGWDAEIVLEDDVYTSSAFYQYACQAVLAYKDDPRIAGIALYGLRQNQTVREPFFPVHSKYDAFFMQLAQSWGQIWMKDQWDAFTEWYRANDAAFRECQNVPTNVCRWPDKSWLKYHIRYCVETNKYFSYPYQALTTDFSDVGENTSVRSRVLQTWMQAESKENYCFPKLGDPAVYYDAWSENMNLAAQLGIEESDLCVDLYGAKGNYEGKRYWLTTVSAPYAVARSFAMELMPMDMNIICKLPGTGIYLYDTNNPADAPQVEDRDITVWSFYNRFMYADTMIWKLSRPMQKKVWKRRISMLGKPKHLASLLKNRIFSK